MAFLTVDNPVMQAELKHQRQIIREGRTGWFWIALAMLMLVPALLTGIVYLAAGLLQLDMDALLGPQLAAALSNGGGVLLMVMHVAMYIVVTLVTLALAAASISREHDGHTWDSLLLTNMTARQIVRGKWWATLRAMWGDHLLVLLLRLGFIAWLGQVSDRHFLPDPPQLLLALLVVAVFSLMDSALTVILGILPPISGRSPVVTALALGLRAFISLLILILSLGVILLAYVGDPLLLLLLSAWMLIYVIFTSAMLRFAEWAAVRNLVSSAQPQTR